MGATRSDAVRFLVLALVLAACDGCDDTKLTVEELQNPETCKECHPKHYEQWSGSMHAYAAEDPVFVAMNKRGQRDTNGELGNFCITCHAPMALQLGLATGANFDPAALPPEAKGVTCFFCHNVAEVTDDHNAPIELAMDQTMRGGARNPVDTPAHNSMFDPNMASATNKSTMCGACHDLVTPNGVHLERSFAEWKTTVFAKNDPAAFLPLTCSGCHMFPSTEVIADKPGLDVKVRTNGFHEHMWPGIDQALTPFPQIAEQKAAIDRDLQPAVAIKGVPPRGSIEFPGGICLYPNGELTVRVDSLNVGHMFPSGAAQDRRLWLEVRAYNAGGTAIFERGIVPSDLDPEETTDPTLNCAAQDPATGQTTCAAFYDRTFKADGSVAHFFWEVDRYESQLIRPAVTLDPNDAAYDHSTTVKYLVGGLGAQIDRVEAQLYMRPLPLAMLRDLEQSGDLDPSIRQLVQTQTMSVGEKSVWTRATSGTGLAMGTPCNPF
jgi:hypothetical protein